MRTVTGVGGVGGGSRGIPCFNFFPTSFMVNMFLQTTTHILKIGFVDMSTAGNLKCGDVS